MIDRKNGLTYADSGVDIDAGNRLVDLIKPMVRATARAGADAEIGGFGGLFDLKGAGLRPGPVAATDGARNQVADRHRDWSAWRTGIIWRRCRSTTSWCRGAEPLFFLDYFACVLDPEAAARSYGAACCR
jgi:phosphoribosylformylglycinamidine cyclo-ligase